MVVLVILAMRSCMGLAVCALVLASLAATAVAGPYADWSNISEEIAAYPGIVEVATGWYDQNPPLFYQIRLHRLKSEMERAPIQLSLYHDAVEAAEQAEMPQVARQLLTQMLQQLKKLPPSSAKEFWVGYYTDAAMLDTEEWLRTGANSNKTGLLQHAKGLLANAEHLAHEPALFQVWVDAKLVGWFLNEPANSGTESTPTSHARDYTLYQVFEGEDGSDKRPNQEAQLGSVCAQLIRLIEKDRVWRFREMYKVVEINLYWNGNLGEMVHMAGLASPNTPASKLLYESQYPVMRYTAPWYADSLVHMYEIWKVAAEDRQRKRTAYMMPLLEQGRHPDTDPHFWDGYVEPKKPPVIDMNLWQRFRRFVEEYVVFLVCGGPVVLPVLWLVIRALVRRRRKRAFAV